MTEKSPPTIDTGTPDVLYERQGAVGWVTFNRPEQRNAMTFAMYEAIVKICDAAEADPSLAVLVFRGAGDKSFVAGTDIAQFRTFTDPQHAIDYEAKMERVLGRLESVARPTIAMIQGYAVGGGAAIAMACDLRICSPEAKFGVPIARTLGNCLAMSNYSRLVDLIGPARTKELIYTARLVNATEAQTLGLANDVVPVEDLRAHTQALAETIAANAPLTIQVTKEAVYRIAQSRRPPRAEDLILKAYMSDDFKEGVNAFLEKRKPVWRGQ